MSVLIRVLLSRQSLQVRPAEQVELILTVQNLSEIVDRFVITIEGVDASWASVSRPELALFPQDQDQVHLSFTPPAGPAAPAGRHDVRVQVVSQHNPAERTTVPLMLEIAAVPALELALRPQRQSGSREGTYRVELSNHGNTDLSVDLEAMDPEEGCSYTFDPPRVHLPAGQEARASLTVRPRGQFPGTASKTYPFTVTARSQRAGLVQETRGEWIQVPPSFELDLLPRKKSGMVEGNFRVQVSNQGATPLTVQLEAADPEEGCRYILDPAQVEVPAGQERLAQLIVRPRGPLRGVQGRPFSFTVTARPEQAPALTREVVGEWEQLPPTFELTLHPEKRQGGAEGVFTVDLRNTSEVDLTLRVEAADPDGIGSYTFTPPEVDVPGGQRRPIRLTVQPQVPLSGAVPRTCRFTVTVRPAQAPELVRQVQGEWEELPPSFELSLSSPVQSNTEEGVFTVQVRNPGHGDLLICLEAQDPGEDLLYTLTPSPVFVPAGQERPVQLKVRPKILTRRAASHAFTVTAYPEQIPQLTRQVHGEWVRGTAERPAPTAEAQPPRFWATVVTMLVGLAITTGISFALTLALFPNSLPGFLGLCALGLVANVLLARKIWRGPKFGPFISVFLIALGLTIGAGFLVANWAYHRIDVEPIVIAIVVWIVGLILSLVAARAVSRS